MLDLKQMLVTHLFEVVRVSNQVYWLTELNLLCSNVSVKYKIKHKLNINIAEICDINQEIGENLCIFSYVSNLFQIHHQIVMAKTPSSSTIINK